MHPVGVSEALPKVQPGEDLPLLVIVAACRPPFQPQETYEMPDNGAMDTTSKIAYLLERISQAVAAHDRENPDHHTWGIGMAHFDIERLGLEDGEEILPGLVLKADGGQTAQFRILCDGQHDEGVIEEEEELADAVSEQEVWETAPAPGEGPGWPPV
jgi:hypothetical protein